MFALVERERQNKTDDDSHSLQDLTHTSVDFFHSLVVVLFLSRAVGRCSADRDVTDAAYSMYIFIGLIYAISSVHLLLACISIVLGIISQSQALVWMAHSVSPIWSGVFVSSTPRAEHARRTSLSRSSLHCAAELVSPVRVSKASTW